MGVKPTVGVACASTCWDFRKRTRGSFVQLANLSIAVVTVHCTALSKPPGSSQLTGMETGMRGLERAENSAAVDGDWPLRAMWWTAASERPFTTS